MRNRTLASITILLSLSLVLCITGCGTDRTSITSSSEQNKTEFQYPEITPEDVAKGPVPGFRFFNAGATANLDHQGLCTPYSTSRWCTPSTNRLVGFVNMISVRITPGDMVSSDWITLTLPLGDCYAVADFYPHPYSFGGDVEITWYLDAFDLPRDFDFTTLVPFYVNDNGEFEQMPFTLDSENDLMIVYTNHFSRYIIGQRILL